MNTKFAPAMLKLEFTPRKQGCWQRSLTKFGLMLLAMTLCASPVRADTENPAFMGSSITVNGQSYAWQSASEYTDSNPSNNNRLLHVDTYESGITVTGPADNNSLATVSTGGLHPERHLLSRWPDNPRLRCEPAFQPRVRCAFVSHLQLAVGRGCFPSEHLVLDAGSCGPVRRLPVGCQHRHPHDGHQWQRQHQRHRVGRLVFDPDKVEVGQPIPRF